MKHLREDGKRLQTETWEIFFKKYLLKNKVKGINIKNFEKYPSYVTGEKGIQKSKRKRYFKEGILYC